jgi:hypothetical protein
LPCAPVGEPSGPIVVPLDGLVAEVPGARSAPGTPRAVPPAQWVSSPSAVQRADHAASSSLLREGRQPKTCPVLRRELGGLVRRWAERTPKDLCGGRGRSGSHRAASWRVSRPARRNAAGQSASSVAEAKETL